MDHRIYIKWFCYKAIRTIAAKGFRKTRVSGKQDNWEAAGHNVAFKLMAKLSAINTWDKHCKIRLVG
ncbi:hypothetical protein SAMN05216524_101553 [Mucilaginibacter sp. OK098]|nr:hypothetical protein SAMN05216524_101553 [Mucilaginibacter sp. OK098]